MLLHCSRLPLPRLDNPPPAAPPQHKFLQTQTDPKFLQQIYNSPFCCNYNNSILRPYNNKRTISVWLLRKRHKPKVKAMRAVVQRVASASVEVEGSIVSAIGPGLLVLVGLHESDIDSDANYICRKVLNMRLFPHENTGKTWDQNVMQRNYEVLLVSQFTLYGILKGNKPDFHVAMPPEKAKPFYASVVEKFRKAYKPGVVKDGVFGAMMKVNLVNDGPVTMQLDSSQSSRSTNNSADAP